MITTAFEALTCFFSFRTIQTTMILCAMPLSMTFVRRWPPFPSLLRAWMLFWQSLCSPPFIQSGRSRLQHKDRRARCHLSPVSPASSPAHLHFPKALSDSICHKETQSYTVHCVTESNI